MALGALILCIGVLFAAARPAGAQVLASTVDGAPASQEPGGKLTRLMLGLSIKETFAPGKSFSKNLKPTFIWRWRGRERRMDDRLVFAYRLSSFHSPVLANVVGRESEVGTARLRPILAGMDYKMPRGKWTWSPGLAAGWSLNKLTPSATFIDRVATSAGTTDIGTDIHNSFAWGPRLKGWYDVNRRLSWMVESAYIFARPQMTVRTGTIEMRRKLNADAFIMKAGIVYGIW